MTSIKKTIYSHKDFDNMGWHDCTIYSINLINNNFELIFDIDFILEWLKPKLNEKNYNFTVAPAVLVFKNVYNLQIDLSTDSVVQINEISRKNNRINKNTNIKEWGWLIDCLEGSIEFFNKGDKYG